ncbi:MAG: hypothetical protein RR053_05710, partial [Evtepia sp.]
GAVLRDGGLLLRPSTGRGAALARPPLRQEHGDRPQHGLRGIGAVVRRTEELRRPTEKDGRRIQGRAGQACLFIVGEIEETGIFSIPSP